jgi:hypothetical protein
MAHQVAVRRKCWDRRWGDRTTAAVNLSLTVGPDGSTGSVSASGDDDEVARCVRDDAQQWLFPAMGCSQAVTIPFHFLRQ